MKEFEATGPVPKAGPKSAWASGSAVAAMANNVLKVNAMLNTRILRRLSWRTKESCKTGSQRRLRGTRCKPKEVERKGRSTYHQSSIWSRRLFWKTEPAPNVHPQCETALARWKTCKAVTQRVMFHAANQNPRQRVQATALCIRLARGNGMFTFLGTLGGHQAL